MVSICSPCHTITHRLSSSETIMLVLIFLHVLSFTVSHPGQWYDHCYSPECVHSLTDIWPGTPWLCPEPPGPGRPGLWPWAARQGTRTPSPCSCCPRQTQPGRRPQSWRRGRTGGPGGPSPQWRPTSPSPGSPLLSDWREGAGRWSTSEPSSLTPDCSRPSLVSSSLHIKTSDSPPARPSLTNPRSEGHHQNSQGSRS